MSDERFENADDRYDDYSANNSNYSPVEKEKYDEYAIVSFVSSIAGFFIFGIILGIVAMVFSAKSKKRIAENPSLKGQGLATAGFVIGLIVEILSVVSIIAVISFMGASLY